MADNVIHLHFEFITDTGLISHLKGKPIRKVKCFDRVNASLTLSEPNHTPLGEKVFVHR